MLQGLQGVLGELGSLMAAPDADVRFLSQLQLVITGKIRQGTQQAIQGPRPGGPPGAGGPPGIGPGMGPQQIGPGGGGGMSGFGGAAPAMMGGGPPGAGAGQPMGQPNPDELRRVMGAQGMTG